MKTSQLAIAAIALAAACAGPRSDSNTNSVPTQRVEFTLAAEDTGGDFHDLGEALESGKTLAFVFWQPWCSACKEESTIVKAAHARKSNEMTFYGVVSGPEGSVDEALVVETIGEWGLPYPTLRDRDLDLTRSLGVDAAPTIVIVEPGGRITYHAPEPPREWTTE